PHDGCSGRGQAGGPPSPHREPADVPVPRKTGRAEVVVGHVHDDEDAHAAAVHVVEPCGVAPEEVAALNTEDDAEPVTVEIAHLAHDPCTRGSGLTFDVVELDVDGSPRPAPVPAGDHRVADGLGHDAVDAGVAQGGERGAG